MERYKGNSGCYLRAQVLREAQKISSPLALISREVPRFHGGSLWHSTPGIMLIGVPWNLRLINDIIAKGHTGTPMWTDRQTGRKTLPSRNFLGGGKYVKTQVSFLVIALKPIKMGRGGSISMHKNRFFNSIASVTQLLLLICEFSFKFFF